VNIFENTFWSACASHALSCMTGVDDNMEELESFIIYIEDIM
jgi:hypothetical protein